MNKLIVILGPTATGKTNLAVQIALKYDAEIISADSRQLYRGMDIGTGKDLDEYNVNGIEIPYHIIDTLDPSENYSVFRFASEFHACKNDIENRGKVPILCGGTALYIESVLLNYEMSDTKPNDALREGLESQSLEALTAHLKSLDLEFYKSWPCDSKRRVIRGIEIASNPEKVYPNNTKINLNDVIVLGVDYPREVIRDRITKRLEYRLNHGMIEEIESLLENGLSSKRLEYFGLEYRWVGRYLNQEIDKQTMFEKLNTAIHQFAKRQMTFFRRMQKRGIEIHWIKNGNFQDALKVIEQNK